MDLSDLLVSYKQVEVPSYYEPTPIQSESLIPEYLINRVQDVVKPESNKFVGWSYDNIAQPTQVHSSENSNNDIVQFFIDKGLTKTQAKGIYGNLMQESNGKLNILSKDGYNSYGLAQWTGPRKARLFSLYGSKPSKQQQLEFIWTELNSTHKNALKALQNSQTVEEATKAFMDKFEKPAAYAANFKARLKYANSIS